MGDDPVGHKSAVGAAGHGQALGINLGIAGQGGVGEIHEVLIICFTVPAADVREPVAPAVGAHGVAE